MNIKQVSGAPHYIMTPLVWSVKGRTTPWLLPYPNQQKSVKPFLSHYKQGDRVSVKFGFSMLWIQMSTASAGSGWCHVWLCMSEQGLGWLIRAKGCRGGLKRCLESSGAFYISAVSRTVLMLCGLIWCSLSVRYTLPLSPLHKPLLPHFPSAMDCMSPQNLACFSGFMENL